MEPAVLLGFFQEQASLPVLAVLEVAVVLLVDGPLDSGGGTVGVFIAEVAAEDLEYSPDFRVADEVGK